MLELRFGFQYWIVHYSQIKVRGMVQSLFIEIKHRTDDKNGELNVDSKLRIRRRISLLALLEQLFLA